MARDNEKYVYWTIAVERNGVTHQAILDDANELNAKNQIPTLLGMRIQEFYALRAAGLLFQHPGQQGEMETKAGKIETHTTISRVDEAQVDANLSEADEYFS